MAATATSVQDALKRVYTQDTLEDQLYSENPWLDRIEKTTKYKVGEVARVPLHTNRNGGYSVLATGSDGPLNAAGQQEVKKAEFNYTHHHQQIKVHGEAIDITQGNALSVVAGVDLEVQGAISDLRKQLGRQAVTNGDGILAQCGTTSSSATVQLATAASATYTSGTNAITRGWLYPGIYVDIGTGASEGSLVNSEAITAVDDTNYTITVTTAITTSSSNYVSVNGSRSGTTGYEMNGMRNVVGTSTFGGLNPATYPVWKAASVDTTAQELTVGLMLTSCQAVHQKSGDEPDFILTGLKQQRKFYQLLQPQVRFPDDSALGAGKRSQPKWDGKEIFASPEVLDEDMFFGRLKHLFMLAIDKPKWQNVDTGGNILAWYQGYDSFVGKLTYRCQLGTNRRNVFARLGGLT